MVDDDDDDDDADADGTTPYQVLPTRYGPTVGVQYTRVLCRIDVLGSFSSQNGTDTVAFHLSIILARWSHPVVAETYR
jgi:hypothetical protein